MAIERQPELAEAYYNRCIAFLHLQEWEKARSDLTTAIELQENIVIDNFDKDYESVDKFKQKYNVKLPEDIAEMLNSQ